MRLSVPLLAIGVAAAPLSAEEEKSLMHQGIELFLQGLTQEIEPHLDELQSFAEQVGPGVRSFLLEMGPELQQLFEDVEDWSRYETPEVLPNGDIIIRRKPALEDEEGDNPEIEL